MFAFIQFAWHPKVYNSSQQIRELPTDDYPKLENFFAKLARNQGYDPSESCKCNGPIFRHYPAEFERARSLKSARITQVLYKHV